MGPKAYDVLKAQGHDLVRVVDFGMFGFLGRPLLVTLKFFHRLLGNWGLAIIAVTVLLKLLLAPLTHQSYQSMRKMTELQPKIRALQERYKNDRTRLSQETMALYKAHKVNPLGGCLPTFIQIPVFFAFYYTLINTVELRHAPFFWWIHDLSAKDPYLITPLLMGVSMIALQLLTPNQQNTNPTQQRMMLLMPIVFTFIFLSLPSGLVLYYLFSNILSIAHLLFFRQWQKNRPLLAQAS
jgi:YidC/Oxa1 family membrane protein insertase